MISVLIQTQDEERNLPALLARLRPFTDIHVLDSGSTDATRAIARAAGATVTLRPFVDWSEQINWALANLPFRHPFVFQIDADERPDGELVRSLIRTAQNPGGHAAFLVERHDHFMGRRLRFTQATSRYIRLFRPGRIRFRRRVHQIPEIDGPVGTLSGTLHHHPFSKGVSQWLERHDAYSRLEAQEVLKGDFSPSLRQALFATPLPLRRQHQKALLYRMPARPLLKFLLMYVLRGGFLDGRAGLTYALLVFFYEQMINARLRKGRRTRSSAPPRLHSLRNGKQLPNK